MLMNKLVIFLYLCVFMLLTACATQSVENQTVDYDRNTQSRIWIKGDYYLGSIDIVNCQNNKKRTIYNKWSWFPSYSFPKTVFTVDKGDLLIVVEEPPIYQKCKGIFCSQVVPNMSKYYIVPETGKDYELITDSYIKLYEIDSEGNHIQKVEMKKAKTFRQKITCSNM